MGLIDYEPMMADKGFAERINGAGSDIAEHHADGTDNKFGKRTAGVVRLRFFLRVVCHDRVTHL
jgi:hypothetical protein